MATQKAVLVICFKRITESKFYNYTSSQDLGEQILSNHDSDSLINRCFASMLSCERDLVSHSFGSRYSENKALILEDFKDFKTEKISANIFYGNQVDALRFIYDNQ